MAQYDFKTDEDIEHWIGKEGAGSIDNLERHLELGLISTPRALRAREYIGRQRRKQMSAAEAAAHALNERAVAAQEASATAARSSALSAAIAIGVSLVSLAVAVIAAITTFVKG